MLGIPANEVSKRQAKLALHLMGHLNTIETYMSTASVTEQITWNDCGDIRRDHPMVEQMRLLLALSQEDIDDLFTLAHSL